MYGIPLLYVLFVLKAPWWCIALTILGLTIHAISFLKGFTDGMKKGGLSNER